MCEEETLLSELESSQPIGLNNRRMEARAEHLKSRNFRSLYLITTALGVGLFVMTITWLSKYRGGFAWGALTPKLQFNYHPILMITMVLIFAQANLMYRSARDATKKKLKLAHAILHTFAFIIAVIGLKAVFNSHNYETPPIPNLYSFHSWIGLTTVIIYTLQFLFGFVTFLFPGLSGGARKALLPIHTAIGISLFMFAIFATLTGLTEKTLWVLPKEYQNLPPEGVLINFIAVFTALFGVLVVYLVYENDYKRVNVPQDEMVLTGSE